MEVEKIINSVTRSGAFAESAFSIKASSKAFDILSSKLYNNVPKAIIRELSTNAYDAQVEAGKADTQFEVHLPNAMDPTLKIRDFGAGLSHDGIIDIYTTYFESTRTTSNAYAGCLGLGCLLKGQPIITINGMCPIEELKVGDLVLTHKGRFRKVTEVMSRQHTGKGYEIHLAQGGPPLVLTDEHPVLVADREGKTNWLRPWEIKSGYRKKTKGIGQWNSYVVLPATIEETTTTIDTINFLPKKFSFSEGLCTALSNMEFKTKTNPKVIRSSRTFTWPNFPERLELDEEMGWFLGLYAAEGSIGKGKSIDIALHQDEVEIADRFIQIALNRFGVRFKKYPRDIEKSKGVELVATCLPLARLLEALCGKGSINKHVPTMIFQGPNAARLGFLRGVLDGDGSSTRQTFSFGVTSAQLAWGVRTLMMVEGKWGSVGYMPHHKRWTTTYNRDAKWRCSFRKGDYLLRPVNTVRQIELDTTVYNVTTEEDNSYVSDFVLHNSKSPFGYSDSFIVTSYNGGQKRVYSMFKGEEGFPKVALLTEEDSSDPSGLEISIGIKTGDINTFSQAAKEVLQHFKVKPVITGSPITFRNENNILLDGTGWKIYGNQGSRYGRNSLAIMGNVAYPITNSFDGDVREIFNLGVEIEFNIGELEVAASREELHDSIKTKATLSKRATEIHSEILVKCKEKISKAQSLWEAHILAGELFWDNYDSPLYDFSTLTTAGLEWNGHAVTRGYEVSLDNNTGIRRFSVSSGWRGKRRCSSYEVSSKISPSKEVIIFYNDLKETVGSKRIGAWLRSEPDSKKALVINGDRDYVLTTLTTAGMPADQLINVSTLPKIHYTRTVGVASTKPQAPVVKRHYKGHLFKPPDRSRSAMKDFWQTITLDPNNPQVYVIYEGDQAEFKSGDGLIEPRNINDILQFLKESDNSVVLYGLNRGSYSKFLEEAQGWTSLYDYTEKALEKYLGDPETAYIEAAREEGDLEFWMEIGKYIDGVDFLPLQNFCRGAKKAKELLDKGGYTRYGRSRSNMALTTTVRFYKDTKSEIISSFLSIGSQQKEEEGATKNLIEQINSRYPLIRRFERYGTFEKSDYGKEIARYIKMIEREIGEKVDE
jgi:hypothetical protein